MKKLSIYLFILFIVIVISPLQAQIILHNDDGSTEKITAPTLKKPNGLRKSMQQDQVLIGFDGWEPDGAVNFYDSTFTSNPTTWSITEDINVAGTPSGMLHTGLRDTSYGIIGNGVKTFYIFPIYIHTDWNYVSVLIKSNMLDRDNVILLYSLDNINFYSIEYGMIPTEDSTGSSLVGQWQMKSNSLVSNFRYVDVRGKEIWIGIMARTFNNNSTRQVWVDFFHFGEEVPPMPKPISTTVANNNPPIPETAILYQNYPNPFNPETTINYNLQEATNVTLQIFNIRGVLIKTLVDNQLQRGQHQVIWTGRNQLTDPVASGIYFYRLNAGGNIFQRKMQLLR